MAAFPEREQKPVEQREEEISPLTIERKEVVQPVLTQFKSQVKSDQGKPLIQSPATATTTITLPADQNQLTTLAKGSISNSITWFAAFWLRMIKKAIHFGWRIFSGAK
jgi:hypothetical protein